MTRINVVPPSELHRKHLIAEYKELPRVFPLSRRAWERGELPTDRRNPTVYTLGTGHVRFFYPRLLFLLKRQGALVSEMLARGYQPQFDPAGLDALIAGMPQDWLGHYRPTPQALTINRARIAERSPWETAA